MRNPQGDCALNPEARQIETDFGKVPLEAVLNTGLFSEAKRRHIRFGTKSYTIPAPMCRRRKNTVWQVSCIGKGVPSTREVSIFSQQALAGRNSRKGTFLACHPSGLGGPSVRCWNAASLRAHGLWWRQFQDGWPSDPQFQEQLDSRWDGAWGDRRRSSFHRFRYG